jgi:hypothetical protein
MKNPQTIIIVGAGHNGRVRTVVLENGERLAVDAVITAIHPKTACLNCSLPL